GGHRRGECAVAAGDSHRFDAERARVFAVGLLRDEQQRQVGGLGVVLAAIFETNEELRLGYEASRDDERVEARRVELGRILGSLRMLWIDSRRRGAQLVEEAEVVSAHLSAAAREERGDRLAGALVVHSRVVRL